MDSGIRRNDGGVFAKDKPRGCGGCGNTFDGCKRHGCRFQAYTDVLAASQQRYSRTRLAQGVDRMIDTGSGAGMTEARCRGVLGGRACW